MSIFSPFLWVKKKHTPSVKLACLLLLLRLLILNRSRSFIHSEIRRDIGLATLVARAYRAVELECREFQLPCNPIISHYVSTLFCAFYFGMSVFEVEMFPAPPIQKGNYFKLLKRYKGFKWEIFLPILLQCLKECHCD